MFDIPEPIEIASEAIDELVREMAEDDPGARRADNTGVPAGFTYLGQFVDHDITFDPMSKDRRSGDRGALVNFRTPRLDLDSLYGSGPVDQPFLYDWKLSSPPGKKLLLAHNSMDAAIAGTPLASEDLPRNHQGRALIGDPRNDENVILTQLHILFIRFHNAVVDHLVREEKVVEEELFDEAQRIVRWHYQWIVVHELLPMVVGAEMADRALGRRDFFTGWDEPYIPLEFSLAAYRFGHSMVRSDYVLQRRAHRATPLFPDLAGFRWLQRRHVIDWELFFDLPRAVGEAPQSSQLINTTIARPLWSLPETGKSLPRLTLERGRERGLPSGQQVAEVVEERALVDGTDTPLWIYVLREAESAPGEDGRPLEGTRLGPVGGRMVAEVLAGLLEGDPTSYLGRQPDWRPEELGTGGSFRMADLVEIAQGRPIG
jgi:hypothetical protein